MRIIYLLILISAFLNCSYTKTTINNYYYNSEASLNDTLNVKTDKYKKNYTVYGYLTGDNSNLGPYIVTAYTDQYGMQELIDSYQIGKPGFFTLSLPQGSFFLYAFRDKNRDFVFTKDECVGRYEGHSQTITFTPADSVYSSVRRYDLEIDESSLPVEFNVNLSYTTKPELTQSSVYPMGTLRDLDDEIFNEKYGTMGLYNPEEFREHIELNFYALSEYSRWKQPILFIHGRKNTPAVFHQIIAAIDQNKFQPWLFYYPSGAAANETIDILYALLFSGDNKWKLRKMIVVTEGTGALILNGTLKRLYNEKRSNRVKKLITISAPMEGEVTDTSDIFGAANSEAYLLDLSSDGRFLSDLKDIASAYDFDHFIFFNYAQNKSTISEDIRKIRSQLNNSTQFSATSIYGFNESSETILINDTVVTKIREIIEKR